MTFEKICNSDKPPHIRVVCGTILFCIFACIRWFDAMRIESVGLDKYVTMCLLEAATSKHKTSMTKETKTMLLPYTSLGRFLATANWAESFMDARRECGLEQHQLFLPSWNELAQSWAQHPMSSGEATCWIREILSMESVDGYSKFSSHSAKCTVFSWAGMCTLFSREERTLLGHHVEPQTRSATIYNRDSQILLQYKVMKLINLIRTGKLTPDASRAERLAMMISNQDEEQVLAEECVEPDINPSDDDSCDADLDESDGHEDQLGDSFEQDRDQIPDDAADYMWYMHCFTGVIHAADFLADEGERLLRGRSVTVNLSNVDISGAEAKSGLICMQCSSVMKRSRQTDGYEDWDASPATSPKEAEE